MGKLSIVLYTYDDWILCVCVWGRLCAWCISIFTLLHKQPILAKRVEFHKHINSVALYKSISTGNATLCVWTRYIISQFTCDCNPYGSINNLRVHIKSARELLPCELAYGDDGRANAYDNK